MSDPVNHPPHYTAGSIEVIDFIEQIVRQYPPEIGYHVGNALKYLSRAPLKGNLRQDLAKGGWYIDRAMSALGKPEEPKATASEEAPTAGAPVAGLSLDQPAAEGWDWIGGRAVKVSGWGSSKSPQKAEP